MRGIGAKRNYKEHCNGLVMGTGSPIRLGTMEAKHATSPHNDVGPIMHNAIGE